MWYAVSRLMFRRVALEEENKMRENVFVLLILIMAIFVSSAVIAADVPPVPAGWTRANSNPIYAFQEYWLRTGAYYTIYLKFMNLNTGEIKDVASATETYAAISSIYDVSPGDAPVVIYGYANIGYNSIYHYTFFKRVSNLNETLQLEGELKSIQFNNNVVGAAFVKVSGNYKIIDLTNLQEVPQRIAISINSPNGRDPVRGNIDILGSAFTESNFQEYRLYCAPKENPQNITLINSSNMPVENGLLGTLDTTRFYDGDYIFTLEVTAYAGTKFTNFIEIFISNINLPPTFVSLADKGMVMGRRSEFKVEAEDLYAPAGSLEYSASGLPSGATFDPSDARIYLEL